MKKLVHLLFVSSFLSDKNGSLCVSEKISTDINGSEYATEIVSRKKNKVFRLLEICFAICFTKANIILIDVYSGQAFLITEIASWVATVFKKKQIFTLHGGGLHYFYEKHPMRVNNAFKRAFVITTPSTMLKSFFESKGFSILLIPNSIELTRFPFKRDQVIPNSILWVRAFDTIYNPEVAVEALAKLTSKFPGIKLTMVGPDKGRMDFAKETARKLNVLNLVEFVGPIPNDELYKYYNTHEVFINTTSLESFGVSLLEAASCGIPIVSTKVGEIPKMWNNGTEMLMIDSIDGALMAAEIEKLLNDKELAKQISNNAFKKVELFNWVNIKPKWIDLLKSVNER
jgi:glycosyltransferase involved in cell wall biosynthesis